MKRRGEVLRLPRTVILPFWYITVYSILLLLLPVLFLFQFLIIPISIITLTLILIPILPICLLTLLCRRSPI